jgi:hypothetical protein
MTIVASGLGRGYLGEHRADCTALGLPLAVPQDQIEIDLRPFDDRLLNLLPIKALADEPITGYVPGRHCRIATNWVEVAAGETKLAIVPVAASADPLVDTVPHPIIRLFPMPVAPPADVIVAGDSITASARAHSA